MQKVNLNEVKKQIKDAGFAISGNVKNGYVVSKDEFKEELKVIDANTLELLNEFLEEFLISSVERVGCVNNLVEKTLVNNNCKSLKKYLNDKKVKLDIENKYSVGNGINCRRISRYNINFDNDFVYKTYMQCVFKLYLNKLDEYLIKNEYTPFECDVSCGSVRIFDLNKNIPNNFHIFSNDIEDLYKLIEKTIKEIKKDIERAKEHDSNYPDVNDKFLNRHWEDCKDNNYDQLQLMNFEEQKQFKIDWLSKYQ